MGAFAIGAAMGLLFGAVIGFFAGYDWGDEVGERRVQTQAVEHGFAYWDVDADNSGSTTFRWNDDDDDDEGDDKPFVPEYDKWGADCPLEPIP